VINLLGLGEPCAGGLPPSVVEIEEHIIKVLVIVTDRFDLVEVRRNVGNFIKVLRANLTDMEINHVAIVSVDFI
jgi:hypothetical protein